MSVVGDTKVNLVAVGLLDVEKPDVAVDALFDVADAAPAFHVNVLPFAIVAINTSPKLSNDQRPGSSDLHQKQKLLHPSYHHPNHQYPNHNHMIVLQDQQVHKELILYYHL